MKSFALLFLALVAPLVSSSPLPQGFATVPRAGASGNVSTAVTSTVVSSPSAASSTTSAPPAATSAANATDSLAVARSEVVQGLQELSATIPQIKNASLVSKSVFWT